MTPWFGQSVWRTISRVVSLASFVLNRMGTNLSMIRIRERGLMQVRHTAIALLLAAPLMTSPASAQVVQSLHLGGGIFSPKGFDSRVEGDVLVRDAFGEQLPGYPDLSDALVFDMSDFRSGQLFGEWNVAFGNHVEVGAGVGFYRRSTPSVYWDLVDEQGHEIDQTLQLRIVPLTAVVRFLPFGRIGDVQPYIGAGVGIFNYRYAEFGRFVDPDTLEIFEQRYRTSGAATGGVVLGGVRFPLGGDIYGLTLEYRHQFATGDTGGLDNGFLDEKIDLGGGNFNIGFLIRF